MDYHELEKTTVVHLREMAQEFEVKGTGGMNKQALIDLLCEKKGIEKPHKVAHGIGKAKVKAKLHELKAQRDQAREAKDKLQVARLRRRMHRLRHKLRRAAKTP